jgi:threonine aldolase
VTITAKPSCQFASDNTAGICPEAWAALVEANRGPAHPYGDDRWTARASDLLRELFETDCQIFFCFNGTAANAMSIAHLSASYHSVICHRLAHLETDECGAPEFYSHGTKVLVCSGDDGKIDANQVEDTIRRRIDIHYPKPRVLSLTQSTEVGTVYSLDELDALREIAHNGHLRVHMDGARFANAVAHLNVAPKEVTWKVGVDILCFGGTKNGMPLGEAVVIFDEELADEFDYRTKQAGQLASKMRFLAAPWVGMLESGAWLKRAQHANACAQRLADGIRKLRHAELMYAVDANAVFVKLPAAWPQALRGEGWSFYDFIAAGGARFMCSWATTYEEVDALLESFTRLEAQTKNNGRTMM